MKSNPSHNFNLPIIIITIVAVLFRTFTFVLLSYRRVIHYIIMYIRYRLYIQAAASNDILELEQKIAELQLRVYMYSHHYFIYFVSVCMKYTHAKQSRRISILAIFLSSLISAGDRCLVWR